MKDNSKLMQVVSAILFSLIIASLLAFGGLLAAIYIWSRFVQPAHGLDDTNAVLCGQLAGGILGVGGGIASLWKFWPRALPKSSKASDKAEGS
jgi:hypothetical protein